MAEHKRFVNGPMAAAVAILAVLALAAAPAAGEPHLRALKRAMARAEAAHPNALWHIVHGLCLRDMRASGNPAPCAKVDLAGRYAVVKDVERKTQYLLVPTDHISGIESPILLAPDTPNYWQAAWRARGMIEQQLGRPIPRDQIGLAINSMTGRTQDQLHIHIDCVKPRIRKALDAAAPRFGPHWTTLTFGADYDSYRARWIAEADLGASDPFKLLARTDAAARADMGREALALIPATRPDGAKGFVVLADRTDEAHDAAAEELLDHKCLVLSE